MGSKEEKKIVKGKSIPRNPNMPITDEEVNSLLKEAAAQISDKSKSKKTGKPQQVKSGVSDKTEQRNANASIKQGEVKADTMVGVGGLKTETTNKPEQRKTADSDKQEGNKKETSGKTEVPKVTLNDSKESTKSNTMASKNVSGSASGTTSQLSQNQQMEKKNSATTLSEYMESRKKNDENKLETAELIITKSIPEPQRKVKIGDIFGAILEGIWTAFKLMVIITVVTIVVGFLLSRDLLVRGRSGERISMDGMMVSSTALSNEKNKKDTAREWMQTTKVSKLTLTADDGSILVARKVIKDATDDKWVVILHGYNSCMEDVYDIAMRYAEEDYNILLPDMRANGESEGSFYGMGWLERLDVINWIDVILKDYPSADVVIHGVDTGAATALMMSGEPLKDSIKAVVAEGAYTSAWDIVKTEYKARHEKWPVFPMMHMMSPVMKVWAGYTLQEADAVKQVKNSTVPILLIRGQNDTYVTDDMTNKINNAIASEHELVTIATGTHGDCRFADPGTYYSETFEFLEKHVE